MSDPSHASPGRSCLDWILPLTAFALYTLLAWMTRDVPMGSLKDEARYLADAQHLREGWFISEKDPAVINGPGYPLLLLPIVAAGLPEITARLLNGVFAGLAVWFLWRAIHRAAGRGWATAGCLVLMLHPCLLNEGRYVMTEALSVCCLTGFLWALTTLLESTNRVPARLVLAAFALTWLTMTRVIFGHVSIAMLLFSLAAMLIAPRHRQTLKRMAGTFGLSLLMCLPYLLYTQSKTGKFPLWSTTAPELQYWLTSTNPGENGLWFSIQEVEKKPELRGNHWELYQHIEAVGEPEEHQLFSEKVKEHVQRNPAGVAFNWACNVCRLFFGFPSSFKTEKLVTLVYVAVNGPVILLALAAIVMAWRCRRMLPAAPAMLLLMSAVYLGGSTLAASLPRYTLPALPLVCYAAAVILSRTLRVKAVSGLPDQP